MKMVRRSRGEGGGKDITYIFFTKFFNLRFRRMHSTHGAHYLLLKIPGLKKVTDIIYKTLLVCFSHTLSAKSLVRSEFQSFII